MDFVFRSGMADPRGCEYREIEMVVGRIEMGTGFVARTRGWILPAGEKPEAAYGIGWNGLIYPLKSVGAPASADEDARDMVRVLTDIMTKKNAVGSIRGQVCTPEDYSVRTKWLTPAKVAMLLRFAPSDVAEACIQLIEQDEPYLLLATDRLWTMYDRATCAHMRGDDATALELAMNLTGVRNAFETEATARGLRVDQRLEPYPRPSEAPGFFPFLDALPLLLEDQQRRLRRSSPLRDPATIADQAERVAALIDQLENISAHPDGIQSHHDLLKDRTIQALIREGWEAVDPLIECYENDPRLTRVIPYSMFGSRSHRNITSVRQPAYVAIESILETTQFAPALTGKETPEETQAIHRRTAAAVRSYWQKYRSLSREDRLYAILQDDQGRWLEAAAIIVQPASKPAVPSARENYPWGLPLDLNDKSPMRGESLRAKTRPSVAELLIKRIDSLAALSAGKSPAGGTVDDASDLNVACDLAICLAKWDPRTGSETLRKLTELTFSKLSPQNRSSLCSHMTLAAQLPVLISIRARADDREALHEYARWFKFSDPNRFQLHPGQLLGPLREFPEDPAWDELWPFLFQDEQSQWYKFLRSISTPDPRRMSSPRFGIEELFNTPIINQPPFQSFVDRLLQDKSPCGTILASGATYWLDQRLSTARPYGYVVQGPEGVDIGGRAFRACDFYAWLLSNRLVGAPAFQLYWPEEERDTALSALEKWLKANTSGIKTRPFQEV